MNGEWLVRLTIWLAVAAWLLRVFIEATGRAFFRRDRLIRWAWFGGAIACTTHVVCAMGFAHCWSLGNAMRHTAQVTRQVMGVEFVGLCELRIHIVVAGRWLARVPIHETTSDGIRSAFHLGRDDDQWHGRVWAEVLDVDCSAMCCGADGRVVPT